MIFVRKRRRYTARITSITRSSSSIAFSAGTINARASVVSASAFGGGGGNIRVQSPGAVVFENSDVNADVATGFGSGGNINVGGGSIAVRDSRITSNTFSGSGGTLQFLATADILLDHSKVTAQVAADKGAGGSIGMAAESIHFQDSIVSASAFSGGGGNLKIASTSTTTMETSRVSAEVLTGLGDGGNLDVDGGALLLRNSAISANAYGGNGGNIKIASKNLLANTVSKVTASSELGIDGTVQFESPAADLSGALFSVSSSFLDATAVLASRCVSPQSRARSSLAMRILDPDHQRELGYLFPAAYVGVSPDIANAGENEAESPEAQKSGRSSSATRLATFVK